MSIYYELRFKDVTLDLINRKDIFNWLKECKRYNEQDWSLISDNNLEKAIPDELKEYSRVHSFYNSFTDDLEIKIILYKPLATLDTCIGNKSKNDDIDYLILMLSRYITSGRVFYYNEDSISEIDYKKISIEFDNIKKSGERFSLYDYCAKAISLEGDNYEEIEFEYLHEGL